MIGADQLDNEPQSYQEAMCSQEAKLWREAIDKELKSLEENCTWEPACSSYKGKVIDTKWVFKKKKDSEGNIQVYKARLVARGFQQEGVSFDEVYSPVTSLVTVRCLVSIAACYNWELHQADICSAFLHSHIDEDVYIMLPDGHNQCGKVVKLKRAIYGLKKAPRYWYNTFNEFLMKKGFVRSKTDLCLYSRVSSGEKTYLIVYVDDILITGSDPGCIVKLKEEMSECFKTKDLGLASHYLGLKIDHRVDQISLNQTAYLTEVLRKFNMLDCHSVKTPLESNFDVKVLSREESESPEIEKRCRKAIGCIMYAMLGTRPDLCIVMSILSRFQSCASEELWKCLKRVMRYVKGTLDLNLVYRKSGSSSKVLQAYVDADWGGDTLSRKSTSGYLIQLFGNTVLWCSKKQGCVALSSTEAEYVALSQCVMECCWLKNIISELGIVNDESLTVQVFEDNRSAIFVANNTEQPKRLKHIDIRYHFVQEKVHSGCVKLDYICTEDQLADFLTKPLSRVRFEKLKCCIGLK